jgi:hypothetical protein
MRPESSSEASSSLAAVRTGSLPISQPGKRKLFVVADGTYAGDATPGGLVACVIVASATADVVVALVVADLLEVVVFVVMAVLVLGVVVVTGVVVDGIVVVVVGTLQPFSRIYWSYCAE